MDVKAPTSEAEADIMMKKAYLMRKEAEKFLRTYTTTSEIEDKASSRRLQTKKVGKSRWNLAMTKVRTKLRSKKKKNRASNIEEEIEMAEFSINMLDEPSTQAHTNPMMSRKVIAKISSNMNGVSGVAASMMDETSPQPQVHNNPLLRRNSTKGEIKTSQQQDLKGFHRFRGLGTLPGCTPAAAACHVA